MGKKGSWFSAVKKALSPDPKEKKDQKSSKPKKKWFGKQKGAEAIPLSDEQPKTATNVPLPPPPLPPPKPMEETKVYEAGERNQDKHAYSVAVATAVAAEAAVAAAQAAAEVVRLTNVSHYYSGKSKEEIAAIRIQTAFRGHLARRALRALRGLVRLKSLVESQSVKRQITNTLKCMQTVARLQSQIRARRIRMSEENQALQKQLQQKHDMELEQQRMGEDWVDNTQSKEKMEASLQSKQEAAMRRERALAYAYTHQMRKNSKSTNPTFMDPNNPHWGWSWLERWMASRPWDANNKDIINDHASVKSSGSRSFSVTPSNQRVGRPPSRQSPSRANSANPQSRMRQSPRNNGWGAATPDHDSKSVQSERPRRHSIAGSLVRDDDSLASSPAVVPSYMASTKSAKAKLGGNGTPDKVSSSSSTMANSAKKKLSFPASPSGPRRHSVPGKMESSAAISIAI